MGERPAIEMVGIRKSYGQLRVLRDIDLCVEPGTVLALLGPNGAGKTTIVHVLSTLVTPDDGTARVAGHDVRREPARVRRAIALTGQYAAVDDLLTGAENLRMASRLWHLARPEVRRRTAELLDRFDLVEAAGRRVGTYSGGMRRRLDLAMGLIGRPSVVFLDEPTTGLDTRARQATWDAVRQLVATGVTVLLTTQYLEEADQLADRVALIDRGAMVAEGTAAELKRRVAGQRLDLVLSTDAAFEHAVQDLAARTVHRDPVLRTVGVTTDGTAAEVRRLLGHLDERGIPVGTVSLHTASLDDVFLALTGTAPATPARLTADV